MIKIENLVKKYGPVKALDGLNLSVEAGAVYGFLGPNGAGKTTTLRILSGLARPDHGQAWVCNQNIGQPGSDIRSLIGVLPEEPAFYPWMTPLEYLRDFTAPLYGLDAKTSAQRAAEMIERVGLCEAAKRRIGGFSRGMRQRLGLAQTLIHKPSVLLLDEPVSALDPAGRKEILDLIDSLRGQTTILLSTHILADVEKVCDMIGIVSHGRMVLQEGRENLLSRYALPIYEIEAENGLEEWLKTIRQLPSVINTAMENHTAKVLVKDVERAQSELMLSLLAHDLFVKRFEIVHPSLEDIFLRLTERESQAVEM